MKRPVAAAMTLAALASLAGPVHAQTSERADLIERARGEVVESTVLNLLLKALDPAVGQPDSLWAVAGYELASALHGRGQSDQAATWLRFVVRHGAKWPLDRTWFTPLSQLYDAAVSDVGLSRDSSTLVLQTSWRWPTSYAGGSTGAVEVRSRSAGVPIQVAVPGHPGQGKSLTLQPGSHPLVISSAEYRSVNITREVLPGVTTLLDVDLSPVLLPEAEAGVLTRLIRITAQRGQNTSCGTGYIGAPGGLIVTTYSNVQGASTIRASDVENTSLGDARVVAVDSAQDIAVLKVASTSLPLTEALDLNAVRSAWSAYFDGCGSSGVAETRINGDSAKPGSLARPLPATANGAPLIDRHGMLLGVVTGPERFVASPALTGVLARALRQPAVVKARSTRRFPWLWVSGGAAVAGIAAGVLAGGSGGSSVAKPTTGGIVITIPR